MKMTKEHLDAMRKACEVFLNRERAQLVRDTYVHHDLSDMRYRWDILHASKWLHGSEFAVNETGNDSKNMDALYKYLNDDHIDTALRSFMPKLVS